VHIHVYMYIHKYDTCMHRQYRHLFEDNNFFNLIYIKMYHGQVAVQYRSLGL